MKIMIGLYGVLIAAQVIQLAAGFDANVLTILFLSITGVVRETTR
jgi:hypothetical protein